MVGDADQTIFESMKASSATYLIDHAKIHGGASVRLRVNFRSTRSIVRFANDFRPSTVEAEAAMVPFEGAVAGDLPEVFYGGAQANVRRAVDQVLKLRVAKVPLETVAILGMVRLTVSHGGNHTLNAGLTYVANLLRMHRVPIAVHFTETSEDGVDVDRVPATAWPGAVNLLTTHSSKGRAWKHVIVLNFNLQVQGFLKHAAEDEAARLVYVAATRARETLTVFVNTGNMFMKQPDAKKEPDVWYPPVRLNNAIESGTCVVRGGAQDLDLQQPHRKIRVRDENMVERGGAVTKFIKDVFALDGGRFEYQLLGNMLQPNGGRLQVTTHQLCVAVHAQEEAIGLDNVHHNDAPILGKCAEMLVERAFVLARGEEYTLPRVPTAKPSARALPNLSKALILDDPATWANMTAMLHDDPVLAVFGHCLYAHQIHNEAKFCLTDERRKSSVLTCLRGLQESLESQGRAMGKFLGGDVTFQSHAERRLRPTPQAMSDDDGTGENLYHGVMDAVVRPRSRPRSQTDDRDRTTICEFKFSNDDVNFRSIMQLILYAHSDEFHEGPPPRLVLWNLRKGTAMRIEYNRDAVEYVLNGIEATKLKKRRA